MRKAVNQVERDRLERSIAGRIDQCPDFVFRLHAIHRFLHPRVEVLDAEAQSIEAQVGQVAQTIGVDGPRVDLCLLYTSDAADE